LTNRWTPAKGNTAYRYDAIGNLTNVIYPISSNLVFQFDDLNRMTNMLDGIGMTKFGWTDGGNLASEDGPWADDTITYSFYNGRRSGFSLQQPNASPWTQTETYNNLQQLANVTSPAGSFDYTYYQNSFNLMTRQTIPGGSRIDNYYDSLARLTDTILYDPSSVALDGHNYSYNEGNQRVEHVVSAFNGGTPLNKMDYAYDEIGQLTNAVGSEYDDTPRMHEQFGYSYDKAGNLASRTQNALTENFFVNGLNELTTEDRSGSMTVAGTLGSAVPTTSVTVSGTGLSSGPATVYNDATWAGAGATLSDGANSYAASATDGDGRSSSDSVSFNLPTTNSFSYDSNGNLISDGTRHFEYDDENQLTAVTVSNAWRSEFTYDALHRRRETSDYSWSGSGWVQTNAIRYVYDRLLVAQERDGSGVALVGYTRGRDLSSSSMQRAGGIGGLLARTDLGLFRVSSSAAHAYYHAGGNGNITAMESTAGVLVALYAYDPFGSLTLAAGPLAKENRYRFSSKEVHVASDIYYFGHRFYDTPVERWLNQDPIGEAGGVNLYSAVHGDWVNRLDPWGEAGPCGDGYGLGPGRFPPKLPPTEPGGEGKDDHPSSGPESDPSNPQDYFSPEAGIQRTLDWFLYGLQQITDPVAKCFANPDPQWPQPVSSVNPVNAPPALTINGPPPVPTMPPIPCSNCTYNSPRFQ
jgi:RHS repeat-associated protein